MAVRYLTDAIDGDSGAASDEAVFERRFHHQSRTLDGMIAYDGLCDPETADNLEAVMRAELDRDCRGHDPRPPAHRQADAS